MSSQNDSNPAIEPADPIDRSGLLRLFEAEGLTLLGVVGLDCAEDYARLREWLSEGRHAEMSYLERLLEFREDPRRLLPEARTALVFGLPYSQGDRWEDNAAPKVAQYARLDDYHRILWRRGERVVESLKAYESRESPLRARVAVDSAPLLERALAAKSSEGFIGKNTCFILPRRGSFFLLGEILVSWSLKLDTPVEIDLSRKTKSGGCGKCELCQVHCPTGALDSDYRIDARKCLSYWTIEHRGTIPEEFWPHLGKYYFGCDICQLVCPYNRKAEGNELPLDLRGRILPSLFETAVMDQEQYKTYFGGTPMTRAKRNGLRRNALIAMVVTSDPKLDEAIERAKCDGESPITETLLQIEAYRSHLKKV